MGKGSIFGKITKSTIFWRSGGQKNPKIVKKPLQAKQVHAYSTPGVGLQYFSLPFFGPGVGKNDVHARYEPIKIVIFRVNQPLIRRHPRFSGGFLTLPGGVPKTPKKPGFRGPGRGVPLPRGGVPLPREGGTPTPGGGYPYPGVGTLPREGGTPTPGGGYPYPGRGVPLPRGGDPTPGGGYPRGGPYPGRGVPRPRGGGDPPKNPIFGHMWR